MNNPFIGTLFRGLVATAVACFVGSAPAQTITQVSFSQTRVAQGSQVTLLIEFRSSQAPWCGLNLNWGNGEEQDLRIGDDDRKNSPVAVTRTFNSAGTFTVQARGKFLTRGLKSAPACEVSAMPVRITVFDEAAERAERQRELERQQSEAARRAAEAQAEQARRESDLRQRELAQRELELKRRELELRETELRREEEARRAAARAAAQSAPAPAPPPAAQTPAPAGATATKTIPAPAAPRASAPAATKKGAGKSPEGF
jgi:hypothetical protein